MMNEPAGDAEAIQAALDSVEATGGGVVHLSPGVYSCEAPISVPSHTVLMGSGWSTVLRNPGQPNIASLVRNKNGDEPAGDDGIVIRDLVVDQNDVGPDPYGKGIILRRTRGFLIDNVKVQNCPSYGIWVMEAYPEGSTRPSAYGAVRNCWVENCSVGIETTNSHDVVIADNYVKNRAGRSFSAIHPWDGSTRIYVAGNRIEGDGGVGIHIVNATDIVIGPNIVSLVGNSGRALATDANDYGANHRITMVGGHYASRDEPALVVDGVEDFSITGARIDGWSNAVYVAHSDCARIANCHVLARGPVGEAVGTYGIYNDASAVDTVVVGNVVKVIGTPGHEYPLAGAFAIAANNLTRVR